ncbi:MAG TPA: carboxypeptidase-like regulatory domain-containing protein [Candidatus Acidoferrales bacterium]|nr:carboxypeptidase-like regulatory domain-containing protein [Candidatus Acidoferrales bacterium]
MRKTLVLVFVAALTLVAVHVNASGRTGTVSGVVIERNGRPAAGAEVMIERSNGSAPVATRTNASGRFLFKFVLSGLYDIRASRGATATVWKHNVMVRRGKETEIELRLEPIKPKPASVSDSRPRNP